MNNHFKVKYFFAVLISISFALLVAKSGLAQACNPSLCNTHNFTCESLGLGSGIINCNRNCSIDTSNCQSQPSCNNIEYNETANAALNKTPRTPANLTAEIKCKYIDIKWFGFQDQGYLLDHYNIYRDGVLTAITRGTPYSFSGTLRSYRDSNISPETAYSYHVTSVNSHGIESTPSVQISVKTEDWNSTLCNDTFSPPRILNLSAQPLAGRCNGIQLKISPVQDIGGSGNIKYKWYRDGVLQGISVVPASVDAGWLLPNHEYRYQAAAIDAAGNEGDLSDSVAIKTPECKSLEQDHPINIYTILVKFSDRADQPYDKDLVTSLFFDSNISLKSYLNETSYGKISIVGNITDWITLAGNTSYYCKSFIGDLGYNCNFENIVNDFKSQNPSLIPQPDADMVIYNIYGMGTTGISGGGYLYLSATNGFKLATIVHELMHSLFHLQHASDWLCEKTLSIGKDAYDPPFGCFVARYGDNYDPMGYSPAPYHFSAYNKYLMGVISEGQVIKAENPGIYILDPIETYSPSYKELRIPLEHNVFYTMEYRRLLGFDSILDAGLDKMKEGLHARLRVDKYPGTDGETLRIDKVYNEGRPFLDPYRKIRVDVLASDKNAIVVKLCRGDNYEQYCGNNIKEASELCDGNDMKANCSSLNYDSGRLLCSPLCDYDYSLCYNEEGRQCTSGPGDLDCNSVVNIFDLVIVASRIGCSDTMPCWDAVADQANKDTGDQEIEKVIDIQDLLSVANSLGSVYPKSQ